MANEMQRIINIIAYGWCIVAILVGITTHVEAELNCEVESYQNEPTTSLFVGEIVNITFTVKCTTNQYTTITIIQKDPNDFKVEFNVLVFDRNVTQQSMDIIEQVMDVNITGTQLIISELYIVALDGNGGEETLLTHYVKVKRVPSKAAAIVRYLVTAAVVVTVWLIGVTTDVKLIVRIFKRPYGIIIGMICQFVIMPFTAWVLAKIFQINGAAAVGLVLDGSCPGGTNSNLFSVLLDVDYVLSITMTFFSTILALAMMPLNLLIYASSFTSAGEKIQTPFLYIIIQLLFLVIPVSIGIFLGWRWPKMKEVADKYIKPVSAVVVTILICTDLPFNLFIFDSPWEYYCACFIFPIVGATAGFIIAKVTRLTTKRAVTVGLETGVQNALIAVTVLTFSYPQPEADLAIRLPYLILIFTTFEGLLLSLIYTILKTYYWHGVPYDDDEIADYDAKDADEKKGKENPAVDPEISVISSNMAIDAKKEDGFDDIDLGSKADTKYINYAYSAD